MDKHRNNALNDGTCMGVSDSITSGPMQSRDAAPAPIPGHVLMVAISQAEQAVENVDMAIKEESVQRDEFVRKAGAAQEGIDRLVSEHVRLMRHLRSLRLATA